MSDREQLNLVRDGKWWAEALRIASVGLTIGLSIEPLYLGLQAKIDDFWKSQNAETSNLPDDQRPLMPGELAYILGPVRRDAAESMRHCIGTALDLIALLRPGAALTIMTSRRDDRHAAEMLLAQIRTLLDEIGEPSAPASSDSEAWNPS
jgi:hypothetical protein